MFKKMVLPVIAVSLIAILLVVSVQLADDQAGHLVEESFDQAQRERAMEAYVARWVAMGERAIEADAAAKLAEAQRERAMEAYVARWVAMGESYAKLAEAQRERAMEAYVARWVAMGERAIEADAAAKLAEAQRERAMEAYVARWVAMGEFYAGPVICARC